MLKAHFCFTNPREMHIQTQSNIQALFKILTAELLNVVYPH